MRFGYVVRPRADQDIDGIAAYIVEQSGLDIGLPFLSEICGTFALLGFRRDAYGACAVV